MAAFTIRYSVGNEHNPGDPWGRSELVIRADGGTRLDHYFSRGGQQRAWAGRVDATVTGELLAALDRAGFPAVPPGDAAAARHGAAAPHGRGGRHRPAGGHRLARHGVAARLRGGLRPPRRGDTPAEREAVKYPAKRGPVVHGAVAIQP